MDNALSRIIAAWIVVIVVAVPLIYSSQLQNSFSLPKAAFLQISVAFLFALFALRIAVAPGRLTSGATPLDLPILAWLAWTALACARSIDPDESMRELLYVASCAGLFFLVTRNAGGSGRPRTLLVLIFVMASAEAAYGIAERLGVKLLYESRVRESLPPSEISAWRWSILGTFGNPNHLASYLALACPLGLGALAYFRGLRRALLLPCLAVTLACLILTGARGSWLAACIGMGTLIAWGIRRPGGFSPRLLLLSALALACALGMLVMLQPAIGHQLAARIRYLFTDQTGSLNARFLAWKVSPRMIARYPLTGSGPDTFRILFLPTLAEHLSPRDPLSFWYLTEKMNETHNELLQIAVETGFAGLALFLFICGRILSHAWKSAKRAPHPEGVLIAAAGAAVVAVLADAATSISFHVVPTFSGFWIIAALVFCTDGAAPPAPGRGGALRAAGRAAVIACLLVFSWIAAAASVNELAFDHAFKAATTLAYQGRYKEALPNFQKALALKPSSGQIRFYYGSTLVQLGLYREGAAILEQSARNFQDIYLFKNLGIAYERTGQDERAAACYERWRRMGIQSHEANNLLAFLRWRQGRRREATTLFLDTLRVRPWDWPAYSSLVTLYMESGRAAEAVRVLNPEPLWKIPEAFTLYGAALLRAGRREEAQRYFLRTLEADPDSVKAHNNLAALYFEEGRSAEAVREWEQVLRIDPRNAVARNNLDVARRAAAAAHTPSGKIDWKPFK